ncbi:MAG: hypothetical protein QXX36_02730 [Candidatus Rehaiarchaeum fermentans]|nr:hypothetical protein [Candidatus Rehaiarchaeum fermentans]
MDFLLKFYFILIGIGQLIFGYELYLLLNYLPLPQYIQNLNFAIGILTEVTLGISIFMKINSRIKYLLPLIIVPIVNIPLLSISLYFIRKSKKIALIFFIISTINLIYQLIVFIPPYQQTLVSVNIPTLIILDLLSLLQLSYLGFCIR